MTKAEAASLIRNMAAKVATLATVHAAAGDMLIVDVFTIEANLILIAEGLERDGDEGGTATTRD